MKNGFILALVGVLSLAGCAETSAKPKDSVKSDPETMLLTYHAKAGKEEELKGVLEQAWVIYRKENLVFAEPHILVRGSEDDGKTRFVEIFTWVSHDAPDHAPENVKKLWEAEQNLCESRNGHGGLEGGEVKMVSKH